jgi:hypothetical protein
MKRLESPSAGSTIVGILQPYNGGTGAATINQAAANLGIVPSSSLDQVNGLAVNDGTGKVNIARFNTQSNVQVSISGPASVVTSSVTPYSITNFDNFTNYTVSAISGSAVISGTNVIYTAGSAAGAGGFIINGKQIDVTLTQAPIAAPTITSPLNAATNIDDTVTVTAQGNISNDTLVSSDWQISVVPDFSTIFQQSLVDTTNKSSFNFTGLSANTTYYVRVRHTWQTNGISPYSSNVSFTTKTSFLNLTQTTLINNSSQVTSLGHSGGKLSRDGTRFVMSTFGQYNDHQGYYQDGSVQIYRRNGNSWVLEHEYKNLNGQPEYTGKSTDIDDTGTRVIVGIYGFGGYYGKAVVLVRNTTNNTWSEEATLYRDGAVSGPGGNGSQIAITAADLDGNGDVTNGAVYMFSRSGSTWSQQQKLTPGVNKPPYPQECRPYLNSTGAFAVIGNGTTLTRSGNVWTVSKYFPWNSVNPYDPSQGAPDAFPNAVFKTGYNVAANSANTKVVINITGVSDQGVTTHTGFIVYKFVSNAWVNEFAFVETRGINQNSTAFSEISSGVAMNAAGDKILYGNRDRTTNFSKPNSGGASVYTFDGSTWNLNATLLGSAQVTGGYFGQLVSCDTNFTTLGITAPGEFTNFGAGHIFS